FKSIFDKIKPIGYYNVKYKTPIKNKTIFYRRDTRLVPQTEKSAIFSRPTGLKERGVFLWIKKQLIELEIKKSSFD
ncbi:MAG: hypothetical protein RR923_06395, partial [Bacilli bacterium]